LTDITDGTSNTVAMSESILGDGAEVSPTQPGDEKVAYKYTGYSGTLLHRAVETHRLGVLNYLLGRRMDPEARERAGLTDGLIRLSVGIEGLSDLRADLGRGLERVSRLLAAAPMRAAAGC
jgi:hypothetical protein